MNVILSWRRLVKAAAMLTLFGNSAERCLALDHLLPARSDLSGYSEFNEICFEVSKLLFADEDGKAPIARIVVVPLTPFPESAITIVRKSDKYYLEQRCLEYSYRFTKRKSTVKIELFPLPADTAELLEKVFIKILKGVRYPSEDRVIQREAASAFISANCAGYGILSGIWPSVKPSDHMLTMFDDLIWTNIYHYMDAQGQKEISRINEGAKKILATDLEGRPNHSKDATARE